MAWNIIGFIVTVNEGCLSPGFLGILQVIEVLLPLILLLVQYAITQVWRGAVNDTSGGGDDSLGADLQFRQHLDLMLQHLSRVEETNLKLFEHDSFLDYVFIFAYTTFLVLFYIYYAAYSIIALSTKDACGKSYALSRAFSFPCLAGVGISGICLFMGLKALYMSSWVSHNLIMAWINRYFPIMRLGIGELDYYMSEEDKAKGLAPRDLAKKLRRDAYEQVNDIVMLCNGINERN